MFTQNPIKNRNALLANLLEMAQSIPTTMAAILNPTSKDLHSMKKGRSKAKAHHIQGKHFKPVHLYEVDGKPMSPSMYRRLHLGVQNPRKQNGYHVNY